LKIIKNINGHERLYSTGFQKSDKFNQYNNNFKQLIQSYLKPDTNKTESF